jgi:hypothetical protein
MIISTEHAGVVFGNQRTFVQAGKGTVYVLLKSLCETLKIDYEKQRRKVRNNQTLTAEQLFVSGTDGKLRKMLCLPMAAVGDWASTIDADTVPTEVWEALEGYLKDSDVSSEDRENEVAADDPEMAEVTTQKDRKERVYNCLGNLNWFLDAFLLWAREMADNDGDYFPGDETVKASPEEVREYVRKARFNIRVLQAIIDASIEYENLDNPVDKRELIEFYNESVKLWRSTNKFVEPFDGQGRGSGKSGDSYMDYLSGPGLDAMTEFGGEIIMNFHEKIIPPKKEGWREIELFQTIADRISRKMGANTNADNRRQALELSSPASRV